MTHQNRGLPQGWQWLRFWMGLTATPPVLLALLLAGLSSGAEAQTYPTISPTEIYEGETLKFTILTDDDDTDNDSSLWFSFFRGGNPSVSLGFAASSTADGGIAETDDFNLRDIDNGGSQLQLNADDTNLQLDNQPYELDFLIRANTDNTTEGDETIVIELTSSVPFISSTELTAITLKDGARPAASDGVTLSETSLSLTELGTSSTMEKTYTVVLDTDPTADVTITVTNGDATAVAVDTDSGTSGNQNTLTFMAGGDGSGSGTGNGNWAVAQTVTVRALNDADVAAETFNLTHTATAASGAYNGISINNIAVSTTDAGHGVVRSKAKVSVAENNETDTYTVVLKSQPSGAVEIRNSITGTSATISPTTLTFTDSDWNTPQTVTVTGKEVGSGRVALFISTTADTANYPTTTTIYPVDVTVTADPRPTVNLDNPGNTGTYGFYTVNEGETGQIHVILSGALGADVEIPVTLTGFARGTSDDYREPNPSSVTIPAGQTRATLSIVTTDDNLVEGHEGVGVRIDTDNLPGTVRAGTTVADGFYIIDNDGLLPSIRTMALKELGGPSEVEKTYSIVLKTDPADANITVTVHVSEAARVKIGSGPFGRQATFTFTPGNSGNWNTDQTVTVRAVNDGDGDDERFGIGHQLAVSGSDENHPYLIARSGNVVLTIMDAGHGVVVSETSLSLLDSNEEASYTVALKSQPSGAVEISATSGVTGTATVSPATLTFTDSDWNTPQTVTVTGKGAGSTSISHAVSTTADATNYPTTTTISPVAITVTADTRLTVNLESPGNTGTYGFYTVNEGETGQIHVILSGALGADVEIPVTLSGFARGTSDDYREPNPSSVTIPAGQTRATLSIVTTDDNLVEGHEGVGVRIDTDNLPGTVRAGTTVANGFYIIDNDGLLPSIGTMALKELGGPSEVEKTYSIVLKTDPADANITVTVRSNKEAAARVKIGSGPFGRQATFTFTPGNSGNWNTDQTVTVQAVNDGDGDDERFGISHQLAVSGSDENHPYLIARSGNVVVTITDAGHGVVVSETSFSLLDSDEEASYTVALKSQPSGAVEISATSGVTGTATVSPATLTFTNSDWNTPQTVTVTGKGAGSTSISHAVSTTADATNYPTTTTISPVAITVTADTRPTVNLENPGNTGTYSVYAVKEGETGQIHVILSGALGADVEIPVIVSGFVRGTADDYTEPNPSSVTILAGQTRATLSIVTTDDNLVEGHEGVGVRIDTDNLPGTVRAGTTVADGFYIIDNDGLLPSIGTMALKELGGPSEVEKTYSIVLKTDPADANITVTVRVSEAARVKIGSGPFGRQATFTFTPGNSGNWNTDQTVTVRAVNDGNVDDERFGIGHQLTVSGSDENHPYSIARSGNVVLTITDAGHGVVVSETSLSLLDSDEEATYTVALKSQPSGAVEIAATSGVTGTATVSPATLTFTDSDWNTPQTVTVTGKGAGSTSISHAVSTTADTTSYPTSTTIAPVAITVTAVVPNAGLTITETDGDTTVSEDGTTLADTYTIALNTEPTHSVTVTVTAGAEAQVNKTGGTAGSEQTLTFTPSGAGIWSAAQTITVTGVDDNIDNTGNERIVSITHAATSTDPNYIITNAGSVSVTVTDDDTDGVTVSETTRTVSEDSGTATYTVALDTEPLSNVTITVTSDDDTVVKLDGPDNATAYTDTEDLVFTPSNWNTLQTVTIQGQNDNIFNSRTRTATITHKITSEGNGDGSRYTPTAPVIASVVVTLTDDEDGPRLTLSPTTIGAEGFNNGGTVTITLIPKSTTFFGAGKDLPPIVDRPYVNSEDLVEVPLDEDLTYQGIPNSQVRLNTTGLGLITLSDHPTGLTIDAGRLLARQTNQESVHNIKNHRSVEIDLSYSGSAITASDQVTITVDNDLLRFAQSLEKDRPPDLSATFTLEPPPTPAGVTISETSLSLTELGTSSTMEKTYTVVLDTDPTADVTITVANGDATAVAVDTDSGTSGNQNTMTFTAGGDGSGSGTGNGNWAVAQTVTVWALNDADAAAETFNLTHAATTTGNTAPYHGISIDPVGITITDAGHGVVVSETSLSLLDSNEEASYTVALKSQPSGAVEISATSGVTGTATVSPATLTFTNSDWNTPQTVTVTGKGAGSTSISHAVSTTADATNYPTSTTISPVAITVTADTRLTVNLESPGNTGTYGFYTVNEGETGQIHVILSGALGADVEIPVTLSGFARGTSDDYREPNPSSVTIPAGQTRATLSIVTTDDNLVEGHEGVGVRIDTDNLPGTVRAGTTVANGFYIIDNDGLLPSIGTMALKELGGPSEVEKTYSIVLKTDPADANITVTVRSNKEAAARVKIGSGPFGRQATFTFTPGNSGNWNTDQTVTVQAVNDGDGDDERFGISHQLAVSGSDENHPYLIARSGNVVLTITDAGHGVVVSETSLSLLDSDEEASYTVALKSQPSGAVEISATSGVTGTATVSPATLTFTNSDWNTPQTVTVTGKGAGSTSISHAVSTTADATNYPTSTTISPVAITVTADTRLTVNLENPGHTGGFSVYAVNEGEAAQIDVILSGALGADVEIPVTLSGVARGTADDYTEPNPSSVTIPAGQTSATLSIVTTDDNLVEGYEGVTVRIDTDNLPGTVRAGTIVGDTFYIIDNDGLLPSIGTMALKELGGPSEVEKTYSIVLKTDPADTNITVRVRSNKEAAQLKIGSGPFGRQATFTFTPGDSGNWNTDQTVTVRAVNDGDGDSEVVRISHQLTLSRIDESNPYLSARSGNVVLTITDAGHGVVVSETSFSLLDSDEEASYTVALKSQPSGAVEISATSGVTGTATVSPATLTFTDSDWNTPQTVTVTGKGAGSTSISHAVSTTADTTNYPTTTTISPVAITVTADTRPTVNLENPGHTGGFSVYAVNEGEAAQIDVILSGALGADVEIPVTLTGVARGTADDYTEPNPSSVTIPAGQTSATLSIVTTDDNLVEGYEGVTVRIDTDNLPGTVRAGTIVGDTFYIIDNDGLLPSIGTMALKELGGPSEVEKTYSIVLKTDPADANITVTVRVSEAAQVKIGSGPFGRQATFTFTPGNSGNWNTDQTVTVRAVNDGDGDSEVVSISHQLTVSGSDENHPYLSARSGNVVLTITDAGHGVVVSETSFSLLDSDEEATYTVALKSQPSGAVEISATSGVTGTATVSPATLTFTDSDWNTPQTVTVTGKGAGSTSISHAVSTTADTTNYPTSTTISPVAITVTAVVPNAGLTITETDGDTTVSEDGTTLADTYTIALNTEPTHNVTVTVTAGAEAQVNKTGGTAGSEQTLTFTPSGAGIWSAAQTITVTGVDDNIDNTGNERTVSITHAATSTDPNYIITNAGSVSVTVTDDDTDGVTVSETTRTVSEDSGTATYTVALDTEPLSNVTITVTSDDDTVVKLDGPDNATAYTDTEDLVFTPSNWNTLQTVTIQGQNDNIFNSRTRTATITHKITSEGNGDGSRYTPTAPVIASVVVTLTDDEDGPRLTLSPTTIGAEGFNNGGTVTITLIPKSTTFFGAGKDLPPIVDRPYVNSEDLVEVPLDEDLTYQGIPNSQVRLNTTGLGLITLSDHPTGLTIDAGRLLARQTNQESVHNIKNHRSVEIDLSYSGSAITANDQVTITVDNDLLRFAQSLEKDRPPDLSATFTLEPPPTPAGVTISETSLSLTELGTSSTMEKTYTLVLDTDPTANVTITVTNGDATAVAVDTDSGTSGNQNTMTFTAGGDGSGSGTGNGNWAVAQTVTVWALNDADAAAETFNLTHAATTTGNTAPYHGISIDPVGITIMDAGHGVVVSETSLSLLDSDEEATYTVALKSQPSGAVEISATSGVTGTATVSPATLTFTNSDWNTPQTVTVTGKGAGSTSISHAVSTTADTTNYPTTTTISPVAITVTADTRLTVNLKNPGNTGTYGFYTVNEGETGQIHVILSGALGADVEIPVTLTGFARGTSDDYREPNPSSVTIPAGQTRATLSIVTTDDNLVEGHEGVGVRIDTDNLPGTVRAGTTVADGFYIIDNDGLLPSIRTMALTELGGPSEVEKTYSIVLKTDPADANITVTVHVSEAARVKIGSGPFGRQATFTFTPGNSGNWNTDQTVTVRAVNDGDGDDERFGIGHQLAVSGSDENHPYLIARSGNVVLTITDAGHGVVVSETSLSLLDSDEEASYTVALKSQPSGAVEISATSGVTGTATVSPATLTFTGSDWNTPQAVTVTGKGAGSTSISHAVSTTADATNYPTSTTISPVAITVTAPAPTAGLTITETDGDTTVSEDGTTLTDTYMVALRTEPTHDVTVTATSGDTAAAMVNPGTLTFTTSNYSTAQTVTVTGVDDSMDNLGGGREVTISHGASSTDSNYTISNAGTVAARVPDDDPTSVSLWQSTSQRGDIEEGQTKVFNITLGRGLVDGETLTVPLTFGGTATRGTDYTMMGAAADGVQYNNLDSGSATVVFTGPESGATDLTAIITLSATADSTVESTAETVVIGLGAITGLEDAGGVSQTDSLEDFSISDPASGVTVSTDSLALTELGTSSTMEKTYTVVLDTDPTADVTITVANGDATAVAVDTDSGTSGNQNSLTFTAGGDGSGSGANGNWATAQTVTVWALNDGDGANESFNLTHTATTTGSMAPYHGITIDPVAITTTDAGHGVVVSEASLSVAENDQTATYTVVLKSQPGGNVEISTTSETTATATASPATLPFTDSNWNTPQTVTVTGKGAGSTSISHAVKTSSDTTNYPTTTTIPAVTVTVTAVAGLVIIETDDDTTVSEDGTTVTDTYTIALNTEPTHNVTVTVTAGEGVLVNQSGGTAGSEQTLTFATSQWNMAQAVTVTGIDDFIDNVGDERTVTISHAASSMDTDYNISSAGSVTVTVTDDDESGISIAESDGDTSVTEAPGASNTDTYTVVLATLPSASVEIAVASGATGAATVGPATLTFTTGNWNIAQTVTVTGVDDDVDNTDDARSATISHTATSTDTGYSGIDIDDVTTTVVDNDTAGATISASDGISVTEAAGATNTGSYTVVLDTLPTASVEIAVASGTTAIATVSPATLTFTTGNWNTAQTVTVTGVDDNVDQSSNRSATISHTVTSTDSKYNNVTISSVTVTVVDDDGAGVTINESDGSTSVTEATGVGRTDTYTVVLASLPSASVEIAVASGATGAATVGPATLTFTTGNWNIAQTVTVTGVDDDVDNTDDVRSATISHTATSTDTDYSGINIDDVTATVADNDTASITIIQSDGSTSVSEAAAGRTDTYTVKLATRPVHSVTIEVASGDTGAAMVSPATLTFTTGTWNTAQTVTVTGVDDNVDQSSDRSATISHTATSTDPKYNTLSSNVAAAVVDDDTAGVTMGGSGSISVTEAAGTTNTGSYTVVLDTLPTASVEIAVASGATIIATVSPATLTFTTGNWNTAQTVTVTGVDDDVDNTNDARSATISHTATSTDTGYSGIDIDDVTTTVVDNDTAGATISASDGISVTEAAGATNTESYTVVLDTLPTASVEIAVASGATTIATVSPASLTFTTGNWNTAQTVTVTGVDDNVDQSSDRSVTISHTATSTDTDYSGIDIDDVTTTVVDNDTAGATISASDGISVTEAAGVTNTESYTVVLDTLPTASVEIAVASGATTIATVSPASLTFTTGNWNTAQTVTVTGVDDNVDQSSDRSATISHTATSTDTDYSGIDIDDVTTTVVDNDTAGATISASGGISVTEAAGATNTGSYTVVLDTLPTASVEIAVASGTTAIATVSPASLTFTTGNWNTPQTVTVTGVDDDVDNTNDARSATISHTVTSTDSKYNNVTISSVTVTVVDDDGAGVTINESDGSTSVTEATGAGRTDTYTVVLASLPSASVEIAVASGATGAATVGPATLTFTTGNWNTAQTVTVTGVDDDVDNTDDARSATISHTATSTDTDYSGINIDDVTATVADNDTASITIIQSDGSTAVSEAAAGRTDTYTVKLATRPVHSVTIEVASGDTGAAMVSPATLTFTTGTWNTAQTVTVTGVDDNVDQSSDRSATISHTATSTDPKYNTLSSNVAAAVVDDDTAGVTMGGSGSISVTEAAGTTNTGSYTVVLDTLPTASVEIAVASGATAIATVSPATLTFTTGNWNTAQTVTVTGVDDNVDQSSNRSATISHTVTSTDTGYSGIDIDDVTTTVVDNDTAGATISASDGISVTEAAGATNTESYTVVLDTLPAAGVEIAVASGATTIATVSPATLTFTTGNWNTAQTVTVTGVDDTVDQTSNRNATINHTATSTDPKYNGVIISSVTVTVVDDDGPGVTINESDGSTSVTEATGVGRTDTYTVVLASPPSASVEIAVASSATGAATVGPATLTFTTANWNTAQTVTVTGVDDDVDNTDDARNATISHTATSTDTGYSGINIDDVTATVVDNDTASITIIQSDGSTSVSEAAAGRTDTYTVKLDSQPVHGVTIEVASDDTGAAMVSPATLTFTTGNWNTAQTVTVTGVDDDVDNTDDARSATISHTATSTDTGYSGIDIDDVTATVVDNDTASITITQSGGSTSVSEAAAGRTDTYTVKLDSQPAHGVTIEVASDDTGAAMVSPATLTFTTANWNTAQTVTVTGVDDSVDQSNNRSVTISHTPTSIDPKYSNISISNVTATVVDNDDTAPPSIPAVQFGAAAYSGGEASGSRTVNVSLSAIPAFTAATTISYTVTGTATAGEDFAPLTGTVSMAGGAGSVPITILDDQIDDDGETIVLTLTAASDYTVGPQESAIITITDDDGVTPPPPALPVVSITGGGGVTEGKEASFTVIATPPPPTGATISVNVMISGSGDFTASGETGARSITIDDGGIARFTVSTEDNTTDEDDGAITATVQEGSGYTSHDSNGSASITVEDNDPVLLTSVSNLELMEGGSNFYTIALDTRPTGDVTVTTSVSVGEGIALTLNPSLSNTVDAGAAISVHPMTLTFTPANWDSPQRVNLTLSENSDVNSANVTLTHTASGGGYPSAVPSKNVMVTVVAADPVVTADPVEEKAAWHLRFGRTLSHQVVDALQDRLGAPPPVVGLQLTVAGETITSATPLAEHEGVLAKAMGFNPVTSEALVEGSSFSFAPEQEGRAPRLAFWGQGALSSFDGQEDALSLDGDVTTLLLGADWSAERWQAGAALGQSWGSGSYDGNNGAEGEISSTVTGLFPYGRYALTPRLGLWATTGYGWGQLFLKPDGAEDEDKPGTTMGMAAIGIDGVLLDGGSRGITLSTNADVLTVKIASEEVDGLESSEGNISRHRIGLEAVRPFPLAHGAFLIPSMEMGIRHDSGDAESGYGLDLGAGILWSDLGHGISGELKGHTLLTHAEESLQEQGLSLSFSWEPSPSNRGPSLSVSHAMGAIASGGMDALLNPTTFEGLNANPSSGQQQFEAELAYGFPAHHDHITLTPALALALSPTSRNYSLLWSLAPYSDQEQGQADPWELSLTGEWQEQNGAASPVEHSLKLRFSLLF